MGNMMSYISLIAPFAIMAAVGLAFRLYKRKEALEEAQMIENMSEEERREFMREKNAQLINNQQNIVHRGGVFSARR